MSQQLPQRQADEVEALSSILGSDFAAGDDAAKTPWSKATNAQPLFLLTLRPDDDEYKEDVWVKIEVRLPKRYPEVPLIVTVPPSPKPSTSANVSGAHLSRLASALKARASDLAATGEEAMWEVYSCGSDLLSTSNLVIEKRRETERQREQQRKAESGLSLEEEKQRREGEGQKAKAQELHRRLEADRKHSAEKASSLAKVIAEREEAIKAERARRKVGFEPSVDHGEPPRGKLTHMDNSESIQAGAPPSPFGDISSRRHIPGDVLHFDPPIDLSDSSQAFADFLVSPEVSHDAHAGHASRHFATPLSGDASADLAAAPRTLYQIKIISPYYSTSRGRKKLAGLEREMDVLDKIRHPNVRAIEGFHLQRKHTISPDQANGGDFTLSIIQAPPAPGEIRLDALLNLQPLPSMRAQSLARDMLASLTALHGRGLLLRDLTPDRVCLLHDGAIVDNTWAGSVVELDRANQLRENDDLRESWPLGWMVPELRSEIRFTRKSDIFVVGRLILLGLCGKAAPTTFENPWDAIDALRKRSQTDASLLKFLSKLLDRSVRKRPQASEAITYLDAIAESQTGENGDKGYLAIDIPSTPGADPATPLPVAAPASPPQLRTLPPGAGNSRSFFSAHPPPAATTASRFLTDFVPLSVLGKGAFGVVSKVKNRLDGGVYAVKKIRLDGGEGEGEEKTLREIGALARVNHPHVTRYYAAWIEEANPASVEELTSTTESEGPSGLGTDSTETTHGQGRSFSVSFGPPKDSDFDEIDGAGDEDFLSHVGFEPDSDADDTESSSADESDDESDSDDLSDSSPRPRRAQLSSRQRSKSRYLSRSKSAARGAPMPKPRWLYIQMELVDDLTLREVIERGPMSIEESWRLLRQILNALVHIHNLGIVHRDLKPSNILMSGPDIKIGDFGLATTLETIPAASNAANGSLTSSIILSHSGEPSDKGLIDGSEDMTGEVGTALYSAPEIVKRQGARYGYKVDMYSLGIVFFEMVASGRVYTTGMERVHRLRELRQPTVDFPPNWPAELVKEREVVEWLVTHNPEERPTPLELLQSDLLPPRLEDESVQETLRLVTDPSSVYHLQLLDALFAPRPTTDEEIRDVTFDAGCEREGSLTNPREAVVIDFLRSIFLRHGAVELTSPLLIPPRKGIYTAKDGNPVQLLDSTGQIVCLPRDHLVPFARVIARSENHRLKRYCIGPVYRESLLAGGQPMSIMAANMDIIVGASGKMPSAAEGECLACLEEILGEVPGFKNDWVVLINHGAILDLLLERVPSKQHAAALSALAALGSRVGLGNASARSKLTQQLQLPKSVVDELETCASMSEEIETAHARLDRLVPLDHRASLAKAIQAIIEVREAARKFGVPAERRFLLTPLLSNYSHCYKGSVFFQIARATGGKKRRGRWDVVASGGRYTSLIARFATPLSGAPPSGVGIQIAISKLVHALAKDQEINELRKPPDIWTPRRADVYVHSGPGLLDMRMSICRELWANGIRADLSYEDDAGHESMLMTAARCKDEGFSHLIYATRSIKVRNLWARAPEAEFQSIFEVVPWLLEQLTRLGNGPSGGNVVLGAESSAGALGSETQVATASMGTAASHLHAHTGLNPETMSISSMMPVAMETQVVLPVHSSRKADKSDRNNTPDRRVKLQSHHPIIHAATREAHKMAASISNGEIPVIAVDLRGDQFDNLCSAAMANESSRKDVAWRVFLDTLPSGEEREYAKTIRGHLDRIESAHGNGSGAAQVMLFSIREKRAALVGTSNGGSGGGGGGF